jgi:hypothetical protein
MRAVVRRAVELTAATLACASPLQAHHSASMFVLTTPVWVHGTVVRFDRINPHSIVTVEETTADGQVRPWAVEGPDLLGLERRGIGPDFLKAGDVVRFCAFPLKEEWRARPPSAVADARSSEFVHGHVVVMPDGQKSLWGSYGKLGECIRSDGDGEREPWLNFLNSAPRAREVWCQQRASSFQATEASKAFVDEINGLLAEPCE